jgi:hypothetical protein
MLTRFLARRRKPETAATRPTRRRSDDVAALLDRARPWLDGTPRVAVIARTRGRRLVSAVEKACPGATVRLFDPRDGLPALHLALATYGRYDVVIDDGRRAGAARRFRTVFFHLGAGGAVVMRVPEATPDRPAPLDDLLERLRLERAEGQPTHPRSEAVEAADKPGRRSRRDFESLAFALDRLEVQSSYVVAVSRISALAKVREVDMDHLLAERAGEDRVVETLSAQVLPSRCEVRSSDPESIPRLRPAFEVPPLSIREYHDVLVRRAQLVVKGNLVLPESFRHPHALRTVNKSIADWAPDFVEVPVQAERNAGPLPGDYFHLDNELRGHFGHFVSELLSHVWAWERVKAVAPTAQVLLPSSRRHRYLVGWQLAFLDAAGLAREDLVVPQGPVRVERLFTSSPMFTMPYYVHPAIEETWTRIGDHLDAQAPDREYARRIFCSRRPGKRGCRNQAEVEERFTRHGFEIVLPEDHPVPEQVRMFRRAEVIAGYSGSGMFSSAFTGGPRHLILVGHAGYTPTNEYMISSVLGHRLDLVVSRPDIPRPEKQMTRESYHSTFAFNPDDEGRFLDEVLAEL